MTVENRSVKRCLILANGKAPLKRVVRYFEAIGFNYLICADGGANSAFRMGLNPDLIIGDLDSIKKEVLDYYNSSTEIIRYKRQNDTDVEKALKYAIRKGYKEAILCGGTGDRLDHSFCNIGVILKFSDRIKIFLHHENSIMYAISGETSFRTIPGEIISVYGIDGATTFTSHGLKYPLRGMALPFGTRESTSNLAVGRKVSIRCEGGNGLIVRNYKTIKQYGHLFNS